MSKKLVAYFSASGVTARVAADLAKASGADQTRKDLSTHRLKRAEELINEGPAESMETPDQRMSNHRRL